MSTSHDFQTNGSQSEPLGMSCPERVSERPVAPKILFGPEGCPVSYTLNHLNGKWKPLLVHMIRLGVNRFGAFQRHIPDISKQVLTQHLRELESDGLIHREIYAEIPPRVEYFLTDRGRSLLPVIDAMSRWGQEQLGIVPSVGTPAG